MKAPKPLWLCTICTNKDSSVVGQHDVTVHVSEASAWAHACAFLLAQIQDDDEEKDRQVVAKICTLALDGKHKEAVQTQTMIDVFVEVEEVRPVDESVADLTVLAKRLLDTTTIDTEIEVYAHRITVRWWDIRGPVTDERLVEEAEERVQHCIRDSCRSGQLVHDTDESHALGWWEIATS